MIDTVATAGILYGISLAEGMRQLPREAIVLCRLGLGPWRVVTRGTLGAGLRLVSWCLPVSVPLVLSSSTADGARGADDCTEAMREHERPLAALRLLGLLTLVTLVAGLPIAVERSGLFGLMLAGDGLLVLTTIQALWTRRMLRRHGMPPRLARRTALRLLNPFAAPRAAEVVYASLMAGVPAMAAARHLLGDEEFVHAFRPAIYDAVHGRSARGDFGLTTANRDRLASLLDLARGSLSGISFCPRCAAEFAPTVARCSDCDDVALVQATND